MDAKLSRIRGGLYEYRDGRGTFVIRLVRESGGARHTRSNANPWLVKYPTGESASLATLADVRFLLIGK